MQNPTILPASNAPMYFFLDPAAKFVTLSTSALPSSLNISSAVNRALGDAVIQSTGAAQPGWSGSAIAGPYLWETTTGLPTNPVGVPGFTFNGSSQFFGYNGLAARFVGTEVGVCVTCVVKCGTASVGTYDVWGLGAGGATPSLVLKYTGTGGTLSLVESSGPYTASTSADANFHVVTGVRNGSNVILRVDGVQVASTAIAAPDSETYTTFSVGAVKVSGSATNFFNGTIGPVLVYGIQSGQVMADVIEVENALLVGMGIQRIAY